MPIMVRNTFPTFFFIQQIRTERGHSMFDQIEWQNAQDHQAPIIMHQRIGHRSHGNNRIHRKTKHLHIHRKGHPSI